MVSPRPNARAHKRPNRCAPYPYPVCLTLPPPPPHNTTQYLMEDFAQRTPSSSSCDGASSSSPILSMLKYNIDDLLARIEGDDFTIPSVESPTNRAGRLSQCTIPPLEVTHNDVGYGGEEHAAERCLGHLSGAHARKSSCSAREVSFFIQGNNSENAFPAANRDSTPSSIIESAGASGAGS